MILTPAVDRLDAADLLPGLRVSRNHDICDLDPPDLLVPVEEYVFVVLYQEAVGVELLGPTAVWTLIICFLVIQSPRPGRMRPGGMGVVRRSGS